MKQQTSVWAAGLAAAVFCTGAWAQQAAAAIQDGDYHQPLAAQVQSHAALPVASTRTSLPVFETGPTAGQRVAQNALIFAARSAVAVAAQRQGTYTAAVSPNSQPYRPDISVPEPATTERLCPPLGTPNLPAGCIDRDAVVTLNRNGIASTTSTP